MSSLEKRKLERVRYWQGQMLRSRDFRDLEAIEAQRRWWHNRALHSAYGVAEGLVATLLPTNAPTAVSVSPGVAYDVFGRELILEKPQTIPLPSNVAEMFNGTAYLLIHYAPASCGLRPDETSEVCWTQAGPVRRGTVALDWKLFNPFCNPTPSDGVALVAVSYTKGLPLPPVAPFAAVSTQPLARPLLASGTTIPGNTAWEPWDSGLVDDTGAPILIGVQTVIDTSAAGFTNVPCYFAWLEGSVLNQQTLQFVPAIFPSITGDTTTGFTFRLWLAGVPPQDDLRAALLSSRSSSSSLNFVTDPNDFFLFAQQQDLYVSWIGCLMQAPLSCCSKQEGPVTGANLASAASKTS